jgi:hypothetical protein
LLRKDQRKRSWDTANEELKRRALKLGQMLRGTTSSVVEDVGISGAAPTCL